MADSLGKLIRDLIEENKQLAKSLADSEACLKEIQEGHSERISASREKQEGINQGQRTRPITAFFLFALVILSGGIFIYLGYFGIFFYYFGIFLYQVLSAAYCGYVLKRLIPSIPYSECFLLNCFLAYTAPLAIEAWDYFPHLDEWLLIYMRLILWPITRSSLLIKYSDRNRLNYAPLWAKSKLSN